MEAMSSSALYQTISKARKWTDNVCSEKLSALSDSGYFVCWMRLRDCFNRYLDDLDIRGLVSSDALNSFYEDINEVLVLIWEKLHHFSMNWEEAMLSSTLPDAFSIAALTAQAILRGAAEISDNIETKIHHLSDAIKVCDMGILMGRRTGSIILDNVNFIELLAAQSKQTNDSLNQLYAKSSLRRSSDLFNLRKRKYRTTVSGFARGRYCAIPATPRPNISLKQFLDNHLKGGLPMVITAGMEDWKACGSEKDSWSNIDYLRTVLGSRTVPVELGGNYLARDASQNLMTFNTFLDDYVFAQDGKVAYLAQHELLEQVPELKADIVEPEFCALLLPEDEELGGGNVLVNAWFGPPGTVSPLHHDPYHNILAQVTGYKYVRLYAPSESQSLYPLESILSNNSQVDLRLYEDENSDAYRLKFPNFATAQYSETVLLPGQMLFIPRWFWHYVESIDEDTALDIYKRLYPSMQGLESVREFSGLACSVSFWWGARMLKKTT